MEITKEQIKRLAKAVKAMQEETLIDDDVSGGYQPDPFKDAYAEIYTVIDECERGLNVDAGENTLPIQRVSVSLPSEVYATYDITDGEVFCAFVSKKQCEKEADECGCGMQTIRLVGNER